MRSITIKYFNRPTALINIDNIALPFECLINYFKWNRNRQCVIDKSDVFKQLMQPIIKM